MNNFLKSAFATVFAVGTGSAACADPVLQTSDMSVASVSGKAEKNYQEYRLQETVLADRTTVSGRVFVDKVLGLTCELKEHGRREADKNAVFHTVDKRQEIIGCVRTVKLPEKWETVKYEPDFSEEALSNYFRMQGADDRTAAEKAKEESNARREAVGMVYQHTKYMNIVREVIEGDNPHAVKGKAIVHTWNLSTGEVCLETHDVSPLRKSPVSTQDWGCFPINNEKYVDKITALLGMQPV